MSTLAQVLTVAGFAAVTAAPTLDLTVMNQAFADRYGAKCLDGSPPYRYSVMQDPQRW